MMRGCDILFLTFVLVGLFPLLLLSTVMTGKKKLHPSTLTPIFLATLARIYFFLHYQPVTSCLYIMY